MPENDERRVEGAQPDAAEPSVPQTGPSAPPEGPYVPLAGPVAGPASVGPPPPFPPGYGPTAAAPATQRAALPLPRSLVVGVLTTAAAAVVSTLVAGLLLALAALAPAADAVSSFGGGSADTWDGGFASFLGFVLVCAGLVLGGEVSVSADGAAGLFSASGSGSAWIFPLLLTAGVLVSAAWWSWRAERREPAGTVWARAVASAAAALVAALVLLALVAISAPRVDEGGVSVLITSAGLRLVAVATVLLTAAGLLGRWLASRAAPAERAAATVARVHAGLPAVAREPLTATVVFSAVFVPLAIIAGTVVAIREDAASAIPLLILMSVNAAALVAVLAQLGGVEASAGAGAFGATSDAITVFGIGEWWVWIAVVAAIAAALVAALRIGVRRARTTAVDLARTWQLPVGVLAGWVLFGFLLFGASAAGSGDAMMFAGDARASLSLAWWSVPVLFAWAAAISLGAEVLPAVAYGLSPRLLEVVVGRSAAAAWVAGGPQTGTPADAMEPPAPPAPPAPLSPRTKRALVATGIAAGAIAVLGIAGAVAVSAVNAGRGPEAAVEQYVGLIAEGRAEAATALVDPDIANAERGFLVDTVLGAATERISDVEVEVSVVGDTGYADVAYRLDGVEQSATLDVERQDNEWLVLESWRVASPLVSEVAVVASGGAVEIGGIEVPLDEYGYGTAVVYPGVYEVSPVATRFFEADPVTAVSAGPLSFGTPVDVAFEPTAALQEEIDAQMTAYVDGCAQQTVGDPEGCPFAVYVYPSDTEVTWAVESYPSVEISEDGTGFRASGGTAIATYIDSGFFSDDEEEVSEEVDISFSGDIGIDGDEVTITTDGYWW